MTVGPYRADIVARIPQDGAGVLIESQLEHANLQHLGQVLAYLAGLEAKIVIWVANGVRRVSPLTRARWFGLSLTRPAGSDDRTRHGPRRQTTPTVLWRRSTSARPILPS